MNTPKPCINTLKSSRNDVHYLFGNSHVQNKINWKFYHSIVYIANEGCHIRILNNFVS